MINDLPERAFFGMGGLLIFDFGTQTCPAVQAGDADWMDYRGFFWIGIDCYNLLCGSSWISAELYVTTIMKGRFWDLRFWNADYADWMDYRGFFWIGIDC